METDEILDVMASAAAAVADQEKATWLIGAVHFLQILEIRLELKEVGLGKAIMREISVRLSNRLDLGHWL